MSLHCGHKILVSLGNILQSEVKSKARGIHHHYRALIQELVDVYEAQIGALGDLLEVQTKKSLKYIIPSISLPLGVKLPRKSYLSSDSLIDPELVYDPKPHWKPEIRLVENRNISKQEICNEPVLLKPVEHKPVTILKPVFAKKPENPVIENKPVTVLKPLVAHKPVTILKPILNNRSVNDIMKNDENNPDIIKCTEPLGRKAQHENFFRVSQHLDDSEKSRNVRKKIWKRRGLEPQRIIPFKRD